MSSGLLLRLDRFSRAIAPLTLSLGLLMIAALPFRLPGLAALRPMWR